MKALKATAIVSCKSAVGCGAVAVVLAGALAVGQTKPANDAVHGGASTNLIYSVKGVDLYSAHCASCHGLDGKGDGPAAAAMKAKTPDLTLLARSNGGSFPAAQVKKTISGDDVLASHGSREMPIWGSVFHQIEYDQDLGDVRLVNLTKYLESIQQK